MTSWSKEIAQAKINDLDVACLTDQDILNLQISMDYAVSMAIVQGARNLSAELPGLLLLQSSM